MRHIFENGDDVSKIRKSLELGQEFLSGNWNFLEEKDIEIRKILGGQSNLLHLVSTNNPKKLRPDEPAKFLVRIHCQPLTAQQIAQDVLVFAVLAERGLGPKIYGFFEGGRLEEYLESRTFNESDVRIEENAHKIGETYRKFHSLQLPISKKPQAILKMREWLEDFKNLGGEYHEVIQNQVDFPEAPKILTINDLQNELDEFEKMCGIFEDTVVFSHNDLAAMNILELNDSNDLIFIDFEYASYNWRGFDLGMHLSEHAYDYRTTVPPFYMLDASMYENNPNVRIVCSSYLKNTRDSVEDLIEECQFFWSLCNMFFGIWSLRNYTAKIDNGIDLRSNASDRFALYFHMKNRSIEIFENRKNY
ncbi:unnamed protein product [Caenorhabditis angaria]|uniref:Uncharacterized protein n=1 Tax=Caenorhabditis angaria TaxID=860376 RepID=A0A9P1IJF2_9PELO|nr:unnamed protein product [Caenorhabditis angaria]